MKLDVRTTCSKCKTETTGRLHFDRLMKLVDSDGGILFEDGWCCHNCLGEPWDSGDATEAAMQR